MMSWRLPIALIALGCLGAGITAQQHQPQGKPDHMHHRFDDPERYAKTFDDPARDSWQMPGRVIEALALSPGASVADVGAGTGYFSLRLAKAVPQGILYAVDIEPSMLEHIRQRAISEGLQNLVAVQASDTSPNIPKPVDLAIIVDTYHHLPGRNVYFRELAKSLAAGGRVAIIDFRKDSPEGPPPEFRFEADQIIGEMKQAGVPARRRRRLSATAAFPRVSPRVDTESLSVQGLGFRFRIRPDGRGRGLFDQRVHQEPLSICRNVILLPGHALRDGAAHLRHEQRHRRADLRRLATAKPNRHGHHPAIQRDVEESVPSRRHRTCAPPLAAETGTLAPGPGTAGCRFHIGLTQFNSNAIQFPSGEN